MVELQSRASLVNASALCAIEQEVKGDGVNVIAEISAELQREKQRNAQLMERILILEAQIKERGKDSLLTDGHANYGNSMEKSFKKFKRQKIQQHSDKVEDGNIGINIELASQMKNVTECEHIKEANGEHHLDNWMSMDETQFMHSEKFRDGDSAADCDDRDDSDDTYDDAYVEDDIDINQKDREHDMNLGAGNRSKDHLREECADEGIHIMCMEGSSDGKNEPSFPKVNKDQKKFYLLPDSKPDNKIRVNKKHDKKESSNIGEYVQSSKILSSEQKVFHEGSGSISLYKKSPKVAFCPKEVKRIIDSKALLLKNAQSHTIRKIIVFSSLAIRHGCEDMYELDFNHFSILRKGEPYVSPKDPGEHVLYENPGVRRKVFYPNHQNPTLCPVHILEEEKAMRPPDACCPSCLFLCIKYGGRTRNLPQNEYVRQHMGRNKLKSFGPAMCLMAMLVHIRSGSFFFKALGITLLFMAGFPDDMVRRETKYRNLDLLQKYYRTDEDAGGEELFLLQPVTSDTQASPSSQQLTGKLTSTKLKGKKQTNSIIKPHNVQRSSIVESASLSSASPTQFGLMGYASIHAHAMSAFQSTPSQTLADGQPISNPAIVTSAHNVSYTNQTPCCMFPPQPANRFMPMMYWPPPNAFPTCPYTSSYGYQPFPSSGNYMSIQPQPYYSYPSCNPFISKVVQGSGKDDVASEEGDNDSHSSSSSTEPKQALQSCQE